MISKVKKIFKEKKGASIMEFFIITVVALIVGAVIFQFGSSVKSGIKSGQNVVEGINGNIQ